jgi:pimeloyl-ACP methyl ester carboxylesterase
MGYFEELDKEVARDMGLEALEEAKKARRANGLRFRTWQFIKLIARGVRRVTFFPLISPLGYSKRFNVSGDLVIHKRAWGWRLVDGILTRLLLGPVILGLFLALVVYANTHPRRVDAKGSPEGLGMYYKSVTLDTLDNTRIAAWYIPAVTADEVAFDPDEALRRRRPGVVVVHGLGASHDQYLPLARHLHDAGFVVLMIDLRGQGESAPGAVTYGLRERADIIAAVRFLRELSMVDETRVAVVGRDIGGVAALEAAALDPSLAAVVADGMWPRFNDRAHAIFDDPLKIIPTGWIAPLYTTAFEIGVRERWGSWDLDTVMRSIHRQPLFFVARTGEGYATLNSVVQLAAASGGRHDVMLADPAHAAEVDGRITTFLMEVTSWKGAKAKGVEEIEKMLEKRVK